MIEVSHLSKDYGPRSAIKDLSFEVSPGEIVGFLGPNGAGKSTTMKILTGFMPATAGKAKVAGYDVFENPLEVKRHVGYLPETPPVYLDMVVEEYVQYAALLHDVPKATHKKATADVIDRVGLGDVRKRLIGNLSKGYRQRVGLAQALVHKPKVLILDEPTVGLDPKQIIDIREVIKGLGGDHTVILSSHILPEITATCKRVIIINKGEIVAQDSLESLEKGMNEEVVFALKSRKASSEAEKAIRSLDSVANVSGSGNELLIRFKKGLDTDSDKVSEIAFKNKMGVVEFSSKRMTLEDIFLKLISSNYGDSREGISHE